MLNVILWKWMQPSPRTIYKAEHVNIVAAMVKRNLNGTRHRIICVTDDPRGIKCDTFKLWGDHDNLANASGQHLPSCYRRLRLYDHATQRDMGIRMGERIISLDVDSLICGDLTALFNTPGRFVGWELKGTHHPRVFNGSLQMFKAGDLQEIWSEFDPLKSPMEANRAGYMGSDQAWLSYKLVNKRGSVGIKYPLLASYPTNIIKQGKHLASTRIIFFHGRVKPWYPEASQKTSLIERYWKE